MSHSGMFHRDLRLNTSVEVVELPSSTSNPNAPLQRSSATRRSGRGARTRPAVELPSSGPAAARRQPEAQLVRMAKSGRYRRQLSSRYPAVNTDRRRLHKARPVVPRAQVSSPRIILTPATPEPVTPVSPIVSPTSLAVFEAPADVPVELPVFESPVELSATALEVPVLPSELPAVSARFELSSGFEQTTGSWQSESERAALRQAKLFKEHCDILEDHCVNSWVRAETAQIALRASEAHAAAQAEEIAQLRRELAVERERAHTQRLQTDQARAEISSLTAALESLRASTLDLAASTTRLQCQTTVLVAQNKDLRRQALDRVEPTPTRTLRLDSSSSTQRTLFTPSSTREFRPVVHRRRLPTPPASVSTLVETDPELFQSFSRFEWMSVVDVPDLEDFSQA